jgi:hypothetical protein
VLRHLDDDRVRRVRVHLGRVGPVHLEHVPGKLDDGALQS